MPKPISMSRRKWVAAWAVLCAAGLSVTAALDASSARDQQPEKSVSAECDKYIADIETQLAKAEQEGKEDGVVALAGVHAGPENDDCDDAFRDRFGGDE
ncbi:hypothetical protein ACWGH5_14870 [Streptomyces sp. NPDC054864]